MFKKGSAAMGEKKAGGQKRNPVGNVFLCGKRGKTQRARLEQASTQDVFA